MKNKTVSVLLLKLLLIGMLTLAFNVQPVKASGTIYIRPDGTVEGTDKILRDGDIYIFTDNIYDEIVVEKDNIVVDGAGYTLQGTGEWGSTGIDLSRRSNLTIKNAEVKAFVAGIYLYESSNISISGNNITNNDTGIMLGGQCNTVSGNNITNNDIGIWFTCSSNNTVSGNHITANNDYGIILSSSSNCSISGNHIKDNVHGVWLIYSSNNTFYHNNFVNNNRHVDIWESGLRGYINFWDNGYPSGGNYWSYWDHYFGVDEFSGPNQNESRSDGIDDTAHQIDADNQDRYPLMSLISFLDAGTWNEIPYYVHAVTDSTVSNFNFNPDNHLISFNLTGQDDKVGFCRVTIPRELMWCGSLEEWNVTVDCNPPTYLKAVEDAYSTYIYFTYSHAIHNVKIASTHAIEAISEEVPFWMEWWFWTIVVAGIVVLAGTVYLMKKRKPPTPTAPAPSTEGTHIRSWSNSSIFRKG